MPSYERAALCTDGRASIRGDDGVSRYSHELTAAMRIVNPNLLVVHDRFTMTKRAKTDVERWRRWLETRRYRAMYSVAPDGAGRLVGRDVFRRINVHFDRFGELMTLDAPGVLPGIVHWSYPMPVRLEGWTNIYTIHDTVPLDTPELTDIDADRHKRVLRAVASGAGALATVSAAARDDVRRWCGDTVVPIVDCGQSVTPRPPSALPGGLTPNGYFLFCGREEARKNVPRLIEAWHRSNSRRALILVGPGQVAATDGKLIRLPAQSGEVLSALQANARALLFPSLVEGFGRPIAEAMILGTAVMTARGHATEEVAGGAALLVDPLDTEAMARAIARLDREDALVAALVSAGRGRAGAFSNARFAERLSALYGTTIESGPSRP